MTSLKTERLQQSSQEAKPESPQEPRSTVVIMAGGTGGHVFPALAVAQALIECGKICHWIGTDKGIEARIVPENNIPLHCLQVKGFRGKGLLLKAQLPIQLIYAVFQAIAVLRRLKPALVVGFGGFASGPGGLAARLLGIPLIIHEQNAIAGTTNRWLAKMATQNLTAFPNALPKSDWVGNPVRADIAQLHQNAQEIVIPPESQETHGSMNILILGGSLGALAINRVVPEALASLETSEQGGIEGRIRIHHQCGPKHLDVTQQAYVNAAVPSRCYQIEPFIADMAKAYQWADVVICRSGALTVSELAAAGCASLLVPFPFAIDDHQTHNARWLVNEQAAVLMPQSQLTADVLAKQLSEWLAQPEQLLHMARAAQQVAISDATDKVVRHCLAYA